MKTRRKMKKKYETVARLNCATEDVHCAVGCGTFFESSISEGI